MLAKLKYDGLDNVHGEAAQVGFTKSNRQDETTEPPSDKQTIVLPSKSDSDVMFCLQNYQGLIINISLVY